MQNYFSLLSSVQADFSNRATLAARLGPSAAAAAATQPPPALSAAVKRLTALDQAQLGLSGGLGLDNAAATAGSSRRRKRGRSAAAESTRAAAAAGSGAADSLGLVGSGVDAATAAVADALFSSAANGDAGGITALFSSGSGSSGGPNAAGQFAAFGLHNSYNSYNTAIAGRVLHAGGAAAAGAAAAGCGGSSGSGDGSSYKGVQYLMAERKWQAYVVDHELTEVSGCHTQVVIIGLLICDVVKPCAPVLSMLIEHIRLPWD
jgi:hypothetical protein